MMEEYIQTQQYEEPCDRCLSQRLYCVQSTAKRGDRGKCEHCRWARANCNATRLNKSAARWKPGLLWSNTLLKEVQSEIPYSSDNQPNPKKEMDSEEDRETMPDEPAGPSKKKNLRPSPSPEPSPKRKRMISESEESEEEGGSSIENQKIAKKSRRKTYASGSSKKLPDTEVDREEGGSFTKKRKTKTSSRRKTCATELSKEVPEPGADHGLSGDKSATQVDDTNPGKDKGKESASTNTNETPRQDSEQPSENQNPNGTPAAKDIYEDWLTPDKEVREGSWISETDRSMEKKLEKVKEVEETLNRLEIELKQGVREISRLVGKQEKEKMKEEVRKIKESLEKSKVDLTAVITK
ncbi:hypothetical protein PGT21_022181 [Puccinia graminis f. sp. tritici]|uniref:Uncharacterized protein n=1 Tax=Puccinia graminis f. sp. tritici TaxID=56615 RepID=A0A5B0N4B6_PUCGR|nr:hypothetical protein PGT21_022181 [Puccinia graminis f. sp. tritici]KAA1124079.1 hypothetical protein PGTUg99_025882 [Puccinia graminis f. sp. tritici]